MVTSHRRKTLIHREAIAPTVEAPAFMRGSSALQAERQSVARLPFAPFEARRFSRAAKGAGPASWILAYEEPDYLGSQPYKPQILPLTPFATML
jgi:hypothetical protein